MNPAMMPQIAALLAQRQQQGQMAPPPQQAAYYGSIPEIAQARANDSRQRLANTAIASGTSTAPVAGGSWAWADGLARALSGVAGGYLDKQNDKKFAAREQDYVKALKASAAMAGTPATVNPSTINPAEQQQAQVAAALAPPEASPMGGTSGQQPPQPIPSFDPGPSAAARPENLAAQGQYGSGAGRVPLSAPAAPVAAPGASPMSAPARSPGGPTGNKGTQLDARSLYFNGIVPIEGGTDPKTGAFRTSPKGAIGPGQVMPRTAPEAAKLAGLPFDDYRYRNDPEYNNALGQAYYTKQLETFGDPVKAAAAYNAGPGRVQRAIRRSQRVGGDWAQYLPDETKDYIAKFRQKVGDIDSDVPVNTTPQQIAQPQYEEVPVALAQAGPPPAAYEVPQEVQTNRIAMAQQMLASGNPDMVAMAQAYLYKGLDEQNAARTLDAQNRMTRNRDTYGTLEADWRQERGDVRQQQMTDRTNAQSRNFTRETNTSQNAFIAGENALDRQAQAVRDASEREFQIRVAEAKSRNARNPFWDSPTGLKIQEEKKAANQKIDQTLAKVRRFLQLNEAQPTGGMYGVPGVAAAKSIFDDQLGEMRGIANEITIDSLGGLGVAISDGDRKFVSDAFLTVSNPGSVNKNRGAMLIAIGERSKAYNLSELEYRAVTGPRGIADFERTWKKYADEVPLFVEDEKGNIQINSMTFDEWLSYQ